LQETILRPVLLVYAAAVALDVPQNLRLAYAVQGSVTKQVHVRARARKMEFIVLYCMRCLTRRKGGA
jgi:hypothetical protein